MIGAQGKGIMMTTRAPACHFIYLINIFKEMLLPDNSYFL